MTNLIRTTLTKQAVQPWQASTWRMNDVKHAERAKLPALFRHHWIAGMAEDVDGLYQSLDRQEEAARYGNGGEQARCLRNELRDFGGRLVASLYALERLTGRFDPLALKMVVDVEVQINAALILLDAIREAIPARRRRTLSLRWFIQPIIERIDDVLSTGIVDLCERAHVEVPEGWRNYP